MAREAADRLGYRPNRSARSLRTRRTATIGLVSDQIAGEQYGSSMLTGASLAARELDHLVVMGESGGDPDLERLLLEAVQALIRAIGMARCHRYRRRTGPTTVDEADEGESISRCWRAWPERLSNTRCNARNRAHGTAAA